MPSIYNTLNIGYTGLSAAQIGIDTTGHNIANAEVDGYTRQRVVASAATPISSKPGQVGNGVAVTNIKRVFDNFVFDRYSAISADKQYSDFAEKTLNELSTYFPEVDGVGIKSDLQGYYNMWQTFADNPNTDAIKIALAKQTETLTKHIAQTHSQVLGLQKQINSELAVNIKEVNDLAKQLAKLNISIDTAESAGKYSANDLRDQRSNIEKTLSKLIGAEVSSGQLESNTQQDASVTKTGSYTLSVNGFNIVDGNTTHPIKVSKDGNQNGFYKISYERQDGRLIPMEEKITKGQIGAILDLRGGTIDSTSGVPVDGILQKSVAEIDAFAKGLIETTNNLYATSHSDKMVSNSTTLNPSNSLVHLSSLNINPGSFDVVAYDIDGNVAASRTININDATTMTGAKDSNSIQGQMLANKDDNSDGNANNDIDNMINFNWATPADGENALELTLDSNFKAKGYSFAIKDNYTDTTFASGTNFAGALGLGRFFDGNSASNIDLNFSLKQNPTNIAAGTTPITGDNSVALDMVQHQFESYDFKVSDQAYNTTANGMFDTIATDVGIANSAAVTKNETVTTQFKAIETEYSSVSQVNIDEEMTNLIKYQTSYGAAAKLITTIDQMMQTLLGIKQ